MVAEKTAQAISAFETMWFLLAFVLTMLCNNEEAFQYSTTKNGFISTQLLKKSFIFFMIRSDPNKRKTKLTILIKQVGHESISSLNRIFLELLTRLLEQNCNRVRHRHTNAPGTEPSPGKDCGIGGL